MKILNTSAPDEYKYETDYRTIPREYLNPPIPQGRGMVKWQPFKTMPEQYERLEQYIKDQNKIDRPSLSDHQLNDLNDKLIFKMYNDPTIEIRYLVVGYIKTKEATFIKQMFTHKHYIYYEETGLAKVNLLDIVDIK
ncbi:YolD-like family protein [Staphylococcus xylosus]|uniref:YolD-like family protein n=1 Tax=Staphylococcus xylosus TaxID=1288 RepID=UPI003CEB5CA3